MRALAWLWLQDQLAAHTVEPEELEELEEALSPGTSAAAGKRPTPRGKAALVRLQARIGNRALGQLLREAGRREGEGRGAPGERGDAAAGPPVVAEPRDGGTDAQSEAGGSPEARMAEPQTRAPGREADAPRAVLPEAEAVGSGPGEEAPATAAATPEPEPPAPEPTAVPDPRTEAGERGEIRPLEKPPQGPGGDPERLLRRRLREVLRTLPTGFVQPAWMALLNAWAQAPRTARDAALRTLETAVARLPAPARMALAEALERLGRVPGSDLISRLRVLLAAVPTEAAPPPPPPPPEDDGG